MQVGSWPSVTLDRSLLWAPCGLTPPSSWALSSFTRWWFGFFVPASDFLPQLSHPPHLRMW